MFSQRYLVVSLGSIGRRHLKNLRLLRPNAIIAALRLTNTSESDSIEEINYQFHSIEQAIHFHPSAAIICSPASEHVSIAKALLEHGISVLIEKPLSNNMEGVNELLQIAASKKLTLMTAYNLRNLTSLKLMHQLVRTNVIGEIYAVRAEVGQYLPDWRPGKRYQDSVSAQASLGGGAILELSHEIDYIYWLFGMPSSVSAIGNKYSGLDMDVNDIVSINLEYDTPKRLVNIHLDFLQRIVSRTCKFIGATGTIIWDGIANSVSLFTVDTGKWIPVNVEEMKDRNTMYLEELEHFLNCVEHNATPVMKAYEGRDVLKIIEAAESSINTKMTITISHD